MNLQYSEPGLDPVTIEGVFKAPVERVFRAWTDPDEVMAWFGQKAGSLVAAEIDLRVGGRWAFTVLETEEQTSRMEGEYLEIVPGARLVFSWVHVRDYRDGRREATAPSRVTVVFEAMGKATRVSLVHSGIGSRDARLGVGKGWTSSFAALRALLETGRAGMI